MLFSYYCPYHSYVFSLYYLYFCNELRIIFPGFLRMVWLLLQIPFNMEMYNTRHYGEIYFSQNLRNPFASVFDHKTMHSTCCSPSILANFTTTLHFFSYICIVCDCIYAFPSDARSCRCSIVIALQLLLVGLA